MLDTHTLLIVLIVSNLLMAGALCIAFTGRFRGGLGPWTGALIVQGFSWLLIASGERIPDLVSVALGNSLLVFSWSLQVTALLAFHSVRTPRWLMYGPGVIAFLFVNAVLYDDRMRLAVGGLAFGVAHLMIAAGLLYYRVAAEQRTRLFLSTLR